MGIFNKIKPTTWIYLCLAIIVCVFVVNYLEIFDFKPDLNGDNVYYYALGRATRTSCFWKKPLIPISHRVTPCLTRGFYFSPIPTRL